MRYCAKATLSQFPLMVIVLSRFAGASLSSQLEILIMAPDNCLQKTKTLDVDFKNLIQNPHLISATLEPPLPMMQPISSLGTVISCVCCWAGLRACPDRRAKAANESFLCYQFIKNSINVKYVVCCHNGGVHWLTLALGPSGVTNVSRACQSNVHCQQFVYLLFAISIIQIKIVIYVSFYIPVGLISPLVSGFTPLTTFIGSPTFVSC